VGFAFWEFDDLADGLEAKGFVEAFGQGVGGQEV
jgi:hypothetical protein